MCFFFNDTATTEIYTLSLHDALPICAFDGVDAVVMLHPFSYDAAVQPFLGRRQLEVTYTGIAAHASAQPFMRSEVHTSELQSRQYLVCRLLLEKKKKTIIYT